LRRQVVFTYGRLAANLSGLWGEGENLLEKEKDKRAGKKSKIQQNDELFHQESWGNVNMGGKIHNPGDTFRGRKR